MSKKFVICGVLILAVSAGTDLSAAKPPVATVSEVRLLLDSGMADSALALAKMQLSIDSANVEMMLAQADIQEVRKQTRARRAILARILVIDSNSTEALLRLTHDFFRAKQPDSAAYFAHVALLGSRGRNTDALYWLGRIHDQAGRPDSAFYYYQHALSLLPSKDLF